MFWHTGKVVAVHNSVFVGRSPSARLGRARGRQGVSLEATRVERVPPKVGILGLVLPDGARPLGVSLKSMEENTMRHNFHRIIISVAVLALCGLLALIWSSKSPAQNMDRRAIVNLYSGGKVVATWEATSVGHLEGNTFVFTVGSPPNPKQVRISGTYSFETLPY